MKVNPIDYVAAGRWQNHVRALSVANEDPDQVIDPQGNNDGGRAFGLLQEHPAFFRQYYGAGGFPALTSDTWTVAYIKAAAAFFQTWEYAYPLALVVQAFNQGADAVFVKHKTAPEYLEKWQAEFARLTCANG
jgi:hypothetical protein